MEGGRVLVAPSGDGNLTRGAAIGQGCLPSRARQGVQVKGTQGVTPAHRIPHESDLRRREFEKGGQGISTANRKWEERVLRKAPKRRENTTVRTEDSEAGRGPGLQCGSKAMQNGHEKRLDRPLIHRPPTPHQQPTLIQDEAAARVRRVSNQFHDEEEIRGGGGGRGSK
jgi:hypothetical protein